METPSSAVSLTAKSRVDKDAPVFYRQNKHVLFGQQEGRCNGCRSKFPFRVLQVAHIITQRAGGQDNIENLQLLCAHCYLVKGDRPQEYLSGKVTGAGDSGLTRNVERMADFERKSAIHLYSSVS